MTGTGRRPANDSPPSCRRSHGRGAVRDGVRTKPDTFIAPPPACIPGRRSSGPRPVGCFMEAATLPRSRGPPVTSCVSWLLVQWAPADRGPVPKNAEEDIPRVPVRRDHPFAADHWRRGGTARPLPHSRREGLRKVSQPSASKGRDSNYVLNGIPDTPDCGMVFNPLTDHGSVSAGWSATTWRRCCVSACMRWRWGTKDLNGYDAFPDDPSAECS